MNTSEWDYIQSLVERALEEDFLYEEEIEREQLRSRLFDLLRPHIHRMVRSLIPDANLAEDITQDALLHLWVKLPVYNPKLAPFKAWVSRVVINLTYNAIRSQGRISRHERLEAEWSTPDLSEEPLSVFDRAADPAPDPSEQASDRERFELILALAQETLNRDEHLVWLEQIINGSSYQEIALLLERNENWARQTMLRARQKLAAAIVLHPKILSDEEIHNAITRCQHSEEPLSESELSVLNDALQAKGARKPPGWRQINLFRQACHKLLPYLLGCLFLALW
ncbi:MAG: RNA polymerase sigma factor [Fimbriimonadales bacterium]|nr:RNA polymerase sigma factor [Fimbriimonadales bacterium]